MESGVLDRTDNIPGHRGMMTTENEKKRVTLEQDKVRQTSHWDLDYLPLREVDALYDRPGDRRETAGASESPRKQMSHRSLGVICIAAGLGLLALTVTVALFF